MRGKGAKLGEGIRDFYVWDFYHFWDSGFLRLGLFRSGKVRGALYCKHMVMLNDDSSIINKLGASLTDDARVIIYNHHVFIVQATILTLLTFYI